MKINEKLESIFAEAVNGMDGAWHWKANEGRKLVLYFYPKDNTPGCIQEGKDFQCLLTDFLEKGYEVVGISKDTLKSHQAFIDKQGYTFPLLADPDKVLCAQFEVLVPKSMFGRAYIGISRTTFIIEADGTISNKWEKVKVGNHAKIVFDSIK